MSELEIKRASKEQLLILINEFSKRSLDDLRKIKPSWACEQHIGNLYNQTLHPDAGEYTILYAFAKEIVSHSDFIEVNPFQLFGNSELSDYRVMKIIARWEEGKHIDPPIIYACCGNGEKLTFLDGRHRTLVAYHLNIAQIPVALQVADKPAIQKIIKLYDHPFAN